MLQAGHLVGMDPAPACLSLSEEEAQGVREWLPHAASDIPMGADEGGRGQHNDLERVVLVIAQGVYELVDTQAPHPRNDDSVACRWGQVILMHLGGTPNFEKHWFGLEGQKQNCVLTPKSRVSPAAMAPHQITWPKFSTQTLHFLKGPLGSPGLLTLRNLSPTPGF